MLSPWINLGLWDQRPHLESHGTIVQRPHDNSELIKRNAPEAQPLFEDKPF